VKIDGEMSSVITWRGGRSAVESRLEIFHRGLSRGELSLSLSRYRRELFNSIYFAPRREDSFGCYYLLPPHRGGGKAASFSKRVASNNRQQ